jgi:hypothetical protein
MKKITILFAALAALVSCNKENPVTPETPSQETYSVTLTAVAPTAGDDTKTTLVEGGKFVHWSKGDAIKVMFAPRIYYRDGLPDAVNAVVSYNSNGQNLTSYFTEATASEALFKIDEFAFEQPIAYYNETGIALYPHTAVAVSSKSYGSAPSSINT